MTKRLFSDMAALCRRAALYFGVTLSGAGYAAGNVIPAEGIKHIVVIGIDGLSSEGVVRADTPAFDLIMAKGSYSLNARGVLPTSSSTNWMSMVSGSGPEHHGVTSNAWERDDYVLPPLTHGMEDIFPTIFGEYRQQRQNADIAVVYTWGGFSRLIERSALNYDVNGSGDQQTIDLAINYLVDKKPEFLFIHLDDVDHAGHSEGHKTPGYLQAVKVADAMVGKLLDAVKKADMLKDTLILVTSDHGGIGYGHGGETEDEIIIPFLAYGAGVKANYQIKEFVYIYDIAATIAYAANIKPHPAWIGKPITSLFSGNPEPEIPASTAKADLPAPILHPEAKLYMPAGKLFINEPATIRITPSVKDAEIRYTLDGTEPTLSSSLYTKPVQIKHSALVKARQFHKQQISAVAQGFYGVVYENTGNGISYRYHEGGNWSFLPVFKQLTPEKQGVTYEFRINDIPERRRDFAIEYDAWIKIEQGGTHKFYTYSDDGSKLFIDGKEVVNNDGSHGTILRAGTIELEPGFYPIRVEYFNEAGGYWLEVFHKPPQAPKQLIKPELLFINQPR